MNKTPEQPALQVHFYIRTEQNEIAFACERLTEKTPFEIADMLETTAYILRMYPNIPFSAFKGDESTEFVRRYHEREIRRQEYPVVRLSEKPEG